MTEKSLTKLRAKLPRGYAKKIASDLNVHEQSVYKALKGKFNSIEIIEAAVKLAKEHADKNSELLSQIKSL